MTGPKNSISVINERRDQVWLLMLKGRDLQFIKRELNLANPTLYRDIQFLQRKSKQFVYDKDTRFNV